MGVSKKAPASVPNNRQEGVSPTEFRPFRLLLPQKWPRIFGLAGWTCLVASNVGWNVSEFSGLGLTTDRARSVGLGPELNRVGFVSELRLAGFAWRQQGDVRLELSQLTDRGSEPPAQLAAIGRWKHLVVVDDNQINIPGPVSFASRAKQMNLNQPGCAGSPASYPGLEARSQ